MTDIFQDLFLNSHDNFTIEHYEFFPEYNAWDRDGFDLYIYVKGKYEMVSI